MAQKILTAISVLVLFAAILFACTVTLNLFFVIDTMSVLTKPDQMIDYILAGGVLFFASQFILLVLNYILVGRFSIWPFQYTTSIPSKHLAFLSLYTTVFAPLFGYISFNDLIAIERSHLRDLGESVSVKISPSVNKLCDIDSPFLATLTNSSYRHLIVGDILIYIDKTAASSLGPPVELRPKETKTLCLRDEIFIPILFLRGAKEQNAHPLEFVNVINSYDVSVRRVVAFDDRSLRFSPKIHYKWINDELLGLDRK